MKIHVNSQPESVNRLGRPNETNRWTIKIVMKSKTDQENVKSTPTITSLRKSKASTSKEKAQVLSNYFSSVFTRENLEYIPETQES